jgi:O-methyltransferase
MIPAATFLRSGLLSERSLAVAAAAMVAARHLEGAIVELGVGRGDTAVTLSHIAAQWRRDLILVDTFGATPLPLDDETDGWHARKYAETFSSLDDVVKKLPKQGFQRICLHDVKHYMGTEPWSFVHVDVDLYQSTRDAITLLEEHLLIGGIAVFDDYGDPNWPGVAKAVDDCLPHDWWTYQMGGIYQLMAIR